MYLSRVHIENWRSYADATFEFPRPKGRERTVLIGAMNGHGKTSFLVSLYLGLFGKYGLRYCEGLRLATGEDLPSYRKALGRFRRRTASADEPTVVDLTFTPTLNDAKEDEVRIIRSWHFSSSNQPKSGESFEQTVVHIGDRVLRPADPDTAQEHIETFLFPAHVSPAFFFDGEQAQALVENMGTVGLKQAVDVLFGTKLLRELAEQMRQYQQRAHADAGGKKKSSEKQRELDERISHREEVNARLARLQADRSKLDKEKEELNRQRTELMEEFARLGGAVGKDMGRIQADFVAAERSKGEAERSISDAIKELGLGLSISRMLVPIRNRLQAEDLLETWEGLKRGTLDKKGAVLSAALPEPPESDPLLGNLSQEVRQKVRDRFSAALERIYEPPPARCAQDYLLGHVKGELRAKLLAQLEEVQSRGTAYLRRLSKRLKEARETFEDAKARWDRVQDLPQEAHELKARITKLNDQIGHANQRLGGMENEERKLKSDLHDLRVEIGHRQDELARLEPDQRRIAVAERVKLVLDESIDRLTPMTTSLLEEYVTKHFENIADPRFRGGQIRLSPDGPEIQFGHGGPTALLESLSGFEKRSFGIAFSLALIEMTGRRVPLVIDTPLGNADSRYRPRTLDALTDFEHIDQVIILTHDKEVTPDLAERIDGKVCQKFLVEFEDAEKKSLVFPNRFFER